LTYVAAVVPLRSALYGALTCKIAASARLVHASSDAKVDACVVSGGIAENPMRKVRGERCALGAVLLSVQASVTIAASGRADRRFAMRAIAYYRHAPR
jgi:hypothetical protein